ncbi:MAG: tyrosine-protein kinase domain-containing protein [Acidimicrobiales bacterium]
MPENERELKEYLYILRRRKRFIILAPVATVGIALAFSLPQPRRYQANAEVLLRLGTQQSLFGQNSGPSTDPAREVATEIEVVTGQAVRDTVRQKFGATPSISAVALGQTNVIRISATDHNPTRAADIANAYANAYVALRRKQDVDYVLSAAQEVQAEIDTLQAQIDALQTKVDQAAPADKSSVQATVNSERDALVGQQALFKSKLEQLQVDGAVRTGNAELAGAATVPRQPVSPKPFRTSVLALVAGLILGAIGAFIAEALDDSVKNSADLERVAVDIPTLALLPTSNWPKDRTRSQVETLAWSSSSAAESYRSLRTALQFLIGEGSPHVILVTSPGGSEGKTTVSANLAATFAATGQRTLLVDCDLRRARIHALFGLESSPGLISVLQGHTPLTEALQDAPGVPNLTVLTAGSSVHNPSELLASPQAADVFRRLRECAGVVIVDSAPLLPVTDSLILSTHVDATIMVVRANATRGKAVRRTLELLGQSGAPLVGTVFNCVPPEAGYYYGGYYKYGRYYTDDRKPAHRASADLA